MTRIRYQILSFSEKVCFSYKEDTRVSGSFLGGKELLSKKDCARLCVGDCVAFSYDSENKWCAKWSRVTHVSPDEGVTSGQRSSCPGNYKMTFINYTSL